MNTKRVLHNMQYIWGIHMIVQIQLLYIVLCIQLCSEFLVLFISDSTVCLCRYIVVMHILQSLT